MNIKEITVSARKSKNFQTYEASMTFTVADSEEIENQTKLAQAWCRKKCTEQLDIDAGVQK